MNQAINVEVYGATYFRSESGQTHCSLFCGQPFEEGADGKGIELMKISCEETVYQNLNAPEYPVKCQLEIKLKKAAGGKMGQHCIGIKPLQVKQAQAPKSN